MRHQKSHCSYQIMNFQYVARKIIFFIKIFKASVIVQLCTQKNVTSGSILLKKSYGRFQFQVKNSLH
jgi:hypothetical protein